MYVIICSINMINFYVHTVTWKNFGGRKLVNLANCKPFINVLFTYLETQESIS